MKFSNKDSATVFFTQGPTQKFEKLWCVCTHNTPVVNGNSPFKAGPPLDLSFWSFLTFLHHGIEEVERHLL